jgi:hypothetical protein
MERIIPSLRESRENTINSSMDGTSEMENAFGFDLENDQRFLNIDFNQRGESHRNMRLRKFTQDEVIKEAEELITEKNVPDLITTQRDQMSVQEKKAEEDNIGTRSLNEKPPQAKSYKSGSISSNL